MTILAALKVAGYVLAAVLVLAVIGLLALLWLLRGGPDLRAGYEP